jgi:hypothetical protein
MPVTINAQATNGLITSADGSGIVKLQSNGKTTNSLGWLNYNGGGTPAVRASYNISSVTKSSTGIYVLNFTNSMSDANYAPIATAEWTSGTTNVTLASGRNNTNTVSTATVQSSNMSSAGNDCPFLSANVFGN